MSAESWGRSPESAESLRGLVRDELESIFRYLEDSPETRRFGAVEAELIGRVFRLGRMLIAVFLTMVAERMEVPLHLKRGLKEFRRQPPKARLLGTFFGKVRYWRPYMHQLTGRGGGFYPLNLKLGLSADGFSLGLLSRAVNLATKMSFSAAARGRVLVPGLGPCHQEYRAGRVGFWCAHVGLVRTGRGPRGRRRSLGHPSRQQGDAHGDHRGTTQTAGKRLQRPRAPSPRHRGRDDRARRGSRKRRKKGDKSKNGRMATMVVMYTLKPARAEDGSARLLGPINRRVYASYAPKRHAFAIARREADKRGFTEESGRLVQIVTDGDEDLARYRLEFFPEAIHTLDVSTSSSVSGRLQAALWVVSANGPSVTASNACLTCGEPW